MLIITKLYSTDYPLPKQALAFTYLQVKSFKNTVGKGEIAHNEEFLLFPQFSTHFENFLQFSSNLKLSFANSLSLVESKIYCLGKVSKKQSNNVNPVAHTYSVFGLFQK